MFMYLFWAAALCTQCKGISLEGLRIVGGELANIEEAPYQVALLLDSKNSGLFRQFCGGSIISRNVVVTAAHCTNKKRASQCKVRAGSTFHNWGGVVYPVLDIVQHVSYNKLKTNFDISLLKLAKYLNFGERIAAVPLPEQGAEVSEGEAAFITGWGKLKNGGSSPENLYKVIVPIVNHVACQKAYGSKDITGNMICAGNIGVGGRDTCQGDSGGPLIVNGTLYGITSWGRGCASPHYPGVYTKVSVFTNWIKSNL